ncbi:MAG: hypothetical protein KGJ13_10735, partial [Patescibacteria group bacterium]|nr:hypothetical protein [Patescibacteria group bacterium]
EKSTPSAVVSEALAADFAELASFISACGNPHAPNKTECAGIWTLALQKFSALVRAGDSERRAARRVRQYLIVAAPFLARSRDSLLKAFKRKLANGVGDRRRNNGKSAPEFAGRDRELLTAVAAKCGGGKDMAWDLTRTMLSPAIQDHYANSRRCPERISRTIRHDIEMEKISLHGPNAQKTNGAHTNRNPDGDAAGDWDQSDDMTMVNIWWDDAPDTPEGFWVGQGQFLLWIDWRSWFAYSWDLISDPYYDSFSICNSWKNKAKDWGVPRMGLDLERGLWETSRLVTGSRIRRQAREITPLQTTMSVMERFELRFQHATHARVKLIERQYGLVQNFFQAAPGYVGRNPITDRYEEVQKQLADVRAGRAHPSKYFLHKSQWAEIIDKVLLRLNSTPKNGKYHRGRSPQQVFEEEFSSKLIHVPDHLRSIFATHKELRPVTKNGIAISFGKRQFRYKGERLGAYRGQLVNLLFDSSDPSIAWCSGLKDQDEFAVELEVSPPAHDPDSPLLAKALAQNAAQDRYMKELHRSLKPYYNSEFFQTMFRPVLADRAAVERATVATQEKEAIKSRQLQSARRATANRNKALQLHIPTVTVGDDERSSRALELLGNDPRRAAGEAQVTEGKEQ